MTWTGTSSRVITLSSVLLVALIGGCSTSRQAETDFTFGFNAPTEKAASFGDGFFVRNFRPHGAMILHPDGTEAWWSVHNVRNGQWAQATVRSRFVDGAFTEPELVTFGDDASTGSPVLSADGNRIYFVSARPVGGEATGTKHVWTCDRTTTGWSTPRPIEGDVSASDIGNLISVGGDHTLLFTRIEKRPSGLNDSKLYRATIADGMSSDVRILPDEINSMPVVADPWLDPEGRFILFMGLTRSAGDHASHLYVSFRDGDGWTKASRVDAVIRPGSRERFPSVTPDGKWLIFVQEWTSPEGAPESDFRWAPVSVFMGLADR